MWKDNVVLESGSDPFGRNIGDKYREARKAWCPLQIKAQSCLMGSVGIKPSPPKVASPPNGT